MMMKIAGRCHCCCREQRCSGDTLHEVSPSLYLAPSICLVSMNSQVSTCIFCQYSDRNHSFPKPVPSSCCSMNPLLSNSKVLCLSKSHYTLPPVSMVKDTYALTPEYPVAVDSKTPSSSLCPSAQLHLSEHSQSHLPFPINWNFLNCARYHLSL